MSVPRDILSPLEDDEMKYRSAASAALLVLLVLGGPAAAQTPKPSGPLPVLRGAIQDTAGKPLDGALIEIIGLGRRMFTPSSGAFRFDEVKPGKYWVVARRIGYAPLQTALTFKLGDDREIVFQLDRLPHVLPEELVKGDDAAWQRRYGDFVGRSRGAFGNFLTRDDIEQARPQYLGDVVRRHMPYTSSDAFFTPAFADFDRTFTGFRRSGQLSTRAAVSRGCSPLVSVNGGTPSGIWAVNDFRPSEVEAVEIYRGNRMMPAEFAIWGTGCGLVVVWTRG
jgi:hypothetical protein